MMLGLFLCLIPAFLKRKDHLYTAPACQLAGLFFE